MVWMQNFEFSHKLVAMVWCPLSIKGQGALDHRNGELVGENFMVSQILQKLVEELTPWMEKGAWNLLAQIGSHGVLWILSTTNVLPLLNGDNQGGYGVVRKVQIEIFVCIPSIIELVGKTLKTNDKWKTFNQWLVEALACPCKHLGVIKFLAIHIETMEAYTLWWNRETLRKMLDYNTKYSPSMDNHTLLWQGGLDMEGRIWQGITFRWNCVKLAWAFLNIMDAICTSLWNFAQWLVQEQHYVAFFDIQTRCCIHRRVWLGWSHVLARGDAIIVGLCKGARCYQHKKMHWWVALELFFVYNKLRITNSP